MKYDFHYNFIKKHFDPELSFTDTDSLAYEIKSDDVYEELFKHKDLFDDGNKKIIGKMKDVSGGKIIDEFVRLKWKMHSIKNIDGKETNTAKEVSVASEFKKFKNINNKIMRHKMGRIQTKNHKLGTCEINKISLSCFDDKRSI